MTLQIVHSKLEQAKKRDHSPMMMPTIAVAKLNMVRPTCWEE